MQVGFHGSSYDADVTCRIRVAAGMELEPVDGSLTAAFFVGVPLIHLLLVGHLKK